MNMLVGSIGTASIAAVNVNSPGAPYEIVLTDPSSPFAPQALTSDIKVGFGVTICESPSLASVRYQCFPPTDTAPPFRATVSGIRSLAEEDKGSVEVSAASTAVRTSRIKAPSFRSQDVSRSSKSMTEDALIRTNRLH